MNRRKMWSLNDREKDDEDKFEVLLRQKKKRKMPMMESQEGISTKKDNLGSDGKSCWKKKVYEKQLQKQLDEKQATNDWLQNIKKMPVMKSQERVSTKKDNLESDGKSCWKNQVYETLQKQLDEKKEMVDWLQNKYDRLRLQHYGQEYLTNSMMESQEGSSTDEDNNLESDENQFWKTLQKYNKKLDEKQAKIKNLKNKIDELECQRRYGTNDGSTDEDQHPSISIYSTPVDLDGTVDLLAIPATTLDQLAEARKSVGYIHCGNVTGTGFLLTNNCFITCKHINELIYNERKKTIFPQCCKTIFVNFDYDSPQMLGFLQAEVDEGRPPLTSQKLDYVIYYLKDNPALRELKHLGLMVKSVKSSLSRSGSGILVGHPGNTNKVFENCRFMPDWRATMEERESKALRYCKQHPAECFDKNKAKLCIHNYKERNLEDDKDKLAYDTTSFFEGSSGSPVFSGNGHIVAMHTRGYPYHQGGKKSCFMSFGTTFDAIYEDLIKQRRVEATSLFPTIKF